MPFVQAKCPNCGGILAVDSSHDAALCPFCNTPYVVEKAINNYNITNNVNVGAGASVNIMGGNNNDFEVVGGILKKYLGESTSIVIPNIVKRIESEVFEGYTEITNVTIPGSVKSIGDKAFLGCSRLKNITISNGVTSIGDYAFYNCSELTNIIIPGSVTSIGINAFSGCAKLESLTIPDSVSIMDNSLSDCSGLKTAGPIGGNYNLKFGWTTMIPPHAFSRSHLNSVIIPNGIINIPDESFFHCTRLKQVAIPSSVSSIGDYAFSGCTGLTRVTIPNGVKSIGKFAFLNCSSLTEITIPNSITNIGKEAFAGCKSLQTVSANEDFLKAEYFEPVSIFVNESGSAGKPSSAPFWFYLKRERRSKKLCEYCGGNFTGLFNKECSKCGRKKSY